MELAELRALTKKALGVYNDDTFHGTTIEEYGQSIDEYLNEGYLLVCTQRYRPSAIEMLPVSDDSTVNLNKLQHEMTALIRIGCGRCQGEYNGGLFNLKPCCGAADTIRVVYEYAPERMRRDTDEPIFKPEISHGILVSYAAYAMLSRFTDAVEKAQMHKAMFMDGITSVKPYSSVTGNQYQLRNHLRG